MADTVLCRSNDGSSKKDMKKSTDGKTKEAVVIGAGVTGLAVAYKLSLAGWKVVLLEKENYVGGLAATFTDKGYAYDLGPHKLYTQMPDIEKEIKKILGGNILTHPKKSAMMFRGSFLDYPINIKELILKLSPTDLFRFGFDFGWELIKSVFNKKKPANAEEYFKRNFGETAYTTIFKPLFSKVYGEPVALDAGLPKTRLPFPSMLAAIEKSIFKKDKPEFSAKEFYYPKKGIGQLSELMAEVIMKSGGKIILNANIKKILVSSGRVTGVEFENNGKKQLLNAEKFISTTPIGDLVKYMGNSVKKDVKIAVGKLEYRSLTVIYLLVRREKLSDNAFIFFPEKYYLFQRVSTQNSFSQTMIPTKKSLLMLELTSDYGEKLNIKKIKTSSIKQLVEIGLIRKEEVEEVFSVQVNRAYPLYDLEYKGNLTIFLDYIETIDNLFTIGREGLFLYTNIDHSLDMGFKLAKFLDSDQNPTKESWRVIQNSFFDYKIVD